MGWLRGDELVKGGLVMGLGWNGIIIVLVKLG